MKRKFYGLYNHETKTYSGLTKAKVEKLLRAMQKRGNQISWLIAIGENYCLSRWQIRSEWRDTDAQNKKEIAALLRAEYIMKTVDGYVLTGYGLDVYNLWKEKFQPNEQIIDNEQAHIFGHELFG